MRRGPADRLGLVLPATADAVLQIGALLDRREGVTEGLDVLDRELEVRHGAGVVGLPGPLLVGPQPSEAVTGIGHPEPREGLAREPVIEDEGLEGALGTLEVPGDGAVLEALRVGLEEVLADPVAEVALRVATEVGQEGVGAVVAELADEAIRTRSSAVGSSPHGTSGMMPSPSTRSGSRIGPCSAS